MFSEQGGVCAICQTDSPGGQNNTLHVDHSHSTGDVRGLLCVNCNKGLGHFQDSIELLAAASDYLSLFILKAIK